MNALGKLPLSQWIARYTQALAAYQQRDFPLAENLLNELWALAGSQSLRSLLLLAHIQRDSQRILSEIRTLQGILSQYGSNEQEAEKKLLADAWSLLGSACSSLGESRLACASFLCSAGQETEWRQKLVEHSNAIFCASHMAEPEGNADFMQELYLGYRNLLSSVKPYARRVHHHRKLRVGYLSADFRKHPVAWFAYALLRHFHAARFQVYCYAVNQDDDEVTGKLRSLPVIWRDIRTKDWAEAARIVYEDEIDILVDLSGHTAGNALPILAWQPATVQVSGIGYFNSTGLSCVDYFLSDRYCAPQEDSPFFTEKLLRLPHTHFCYTVPRKFPETAEAIPCLRKGYVSFGCFNNFAKITDEMLKLWQKILSKVSGARLILKHKIFDDPEGSRHAAKRLAHAGLDLARVEFRGYTENYLEDYRDVDIALDTAPYTGGLTTCEALYMGVPVISLAGGRHGARFGYSLLMNIGLGELAAHSGDAYVDIAAALAKEPSILQALHRDLRHRMENSPLMDGPGYTAAVEAAYERIWAMKARTIEKRMRAPDEPAHDAVSYRDALREKVEHFLLPADERTEILFCEDAMGLAAYLRGKYPQMHIQAWAEKDKHAFLETPEQCGQATYQRIFAGRILEESTWPERVAVGLRKRLCRNGSVLFLVGNAQHGSIWQNLWDGHWPYGEKNEILQPNIAHLFTVRTAVQLLMDASYEDIVVETIEKPVDASWHARLRQMGMTAEQNGQNLIDTQFWLFEARRVDEEGIRLRSLFPTDVRKQLSRFLHRIENDIDVEINAEKVWELCAEEKIDFDDLLAFIQHAMAFPRRTIQNLANVQQRGQPG